MENIQYNALFSEIIQCQSKLKHSVFGEVYLKHFSYSEAGDIETKYFEYLDEAKSNSLPTYKQQEEYIIKEGLWSQNDETDILLQEQFLDSLKLNYSKEYLNSRRIQMKSSIDDAEIKLQSLRLRKESYMSKTAESFANQKTLNYKVSNSFFKDKKLTENISENCDGSEYEEFIGLFYKAQSRLGHDSLKRLSISSVFTNLFYLIEDNIYQFYGKPIIDLSNYQVDLFMWGRYFKHILQEQGNTIPQDVKNNPDKLINWIDLRKNARDARVIDDEKSGNMSIVGAKKEDYEILGLQITNNTNMNKKLKEKSILTKEDLFAMDS